MQKIITFYKKRKTAFYKKEKINQTVEPVWTKFRRFNLVW